VTKIYKKILIAMDDSEDAFRAAKRVIELVKSIEVKTLEENTRMKVVAFHSIMHHAFSQGLLIPIPSPFGSSSYMIPSIDYERLEQDYREHGKQILRKVKELFDKENLPIETRLIDDQTPAVYISKVKEEENFDLVVLGCKGDHSRLEELLLGTVANEVRNKVDSDIWIVR
jgi:nucleotide-binding universal stress UspA family protein